MFLFEQNTSFLCAYDTIHRSHESPPFYGHEYVISSLVRPHVLKVINLTGGWDYVSSVGNAYGVVIKGVENDYL